MAKIKDPANQKNAFQNILVQKRANVTEDLLRVLMFTDGVCISQSEATDKNMIKLDRKYLILFLIDIGNSKYHVIIGSKGPCKLSVNVGGKIFRAPHEIMNRGLIDINQVKFLGNVVKSGQKKKANRSDSKNRGRSNPTT